MSRPLLLVSAQIALLGIGFIKDQIDVMLRLGDHVRRDLGIAVVLIAEALGVEVDHDATAVSKTLIHGAHALAVEAVALISVHVLNRSAQFHAPENAFARSARSDHGIGIHDSRGCTSQAFPYWPQSRWSPRTTLSA